ncbi:hypothetical protein E2C01_064900 [Portunus trituberculatus]|uniref:Uncharacterized protein n=1 Tax=Portunus trituberculatus TaxID=210409 RepID=A0A5B7HM32_PORTR|nr:hypothetical protein [Portunus trituberculatus]
MCFRLRCNGVLQECFVVYYCNAPRTTYPIYVLFIHLLFHCILCLYFVIRMYVLYYLYTFRVSLTSPPLSSFVREEAIVPEPMGLFYNARPLEGLKRLANESIDYTMWCNAFPRNKGWEPTQTRPLWAAC